MSVLYAIAVVLYAFAHIFAVMDGVSYALSEWLNFESAIMRWIFDWIILSGISIFIAVIPVVGSVVAAYGAVNVWDWTLLQAIILFFGFIPLTIALMALGYIR